MCGVGGALWSMIEGGLWVLADELIKWDGDEGISFFCAGVVSGAFLVVAFVDSGDGFVGTASEAGYESFDGDSADGPAGSYGAA